MSDRPQGAPAPRKPIRLAIVVSHPIQYYVPLYQRLARRDDIDLKVFFTWHAADKAVADHGFGKMVAWDIPLTQGYEFELVPNVSADPGTHHFFGLRNPSLVECVVNWKPDAAIVTGWAWQSHLIAMRALPRRGIPVLFRGDSHLLDSPRRSGARWLLKHAVLSRVYSWPAACLFVGEANRAYYEAFGVDPRRLFRCPHSIDVERFAQPAEALESQARQWREELQIGDDCVSLLFAGKFEPKKRPLELMRAIQSLNDSRLVLVMVGDGQLEREVRAIAAQDPKRFRVIPFQNQTRMPVVYRLGDMLVLPSSYGETWGLAVNEAMACGRPAIVSDRVGCAADLVDDACGRVFPWQDLAALAQAVSDMAGNRDRLSSMGRSASARARMFDIGSTESALMDCLGGLDLQ
ncbi:MAG: glycosyltransferase family 4 protein [Usitatibacter sp.]